MLYDVLHDKDGQIVQIHERLRSEPRLKGRDGLRVKTVKSLPTTQVELKNNELKPREKLKSIVRIPTIKNKEITVIREHKSIGDAVSMLSGIQDLYSRGIKVYLQVHENSYPLFKHHPAVYKLQHLEDEAETSTVVNLSRPCPAGNYESNNDNPELSRNRIFALAMAAKDIKKPELYLTQAELEAGQKLIKHDGALGVVLRSAEIWKDWQHTRQFIDLAKDEYTVYTIDKTLEIDDVNNLVELNIRTLASALVNLSCVITPDTGIMHLCEALSIPCIALFGSMRIDRYFNRPFESSVTFLQGECELDREPCMYDRCRGKGEYQPCMNWFNPGYVIEKVEEKIYGYDSNKSRWEEGIFQ